MKLYHISQSANSGYDTYDSAVVAAHDEDDARNINPCSYGPISLSWGDHPENFGWCYSQDQVIVKLIGEAASNIGRGVVCASFNAG